MPRSIPWLLGALLLAGLAYLGWKQRAGASLAPEAPLPSGRTPGSLQAENERLKRRVAELERQVAKTGAASTAPALSSVQAIQGPPVDRADLAAKARAALDAKDYAAFTGAYFALLDAGEPFPPEAATLLEGFDLEAIRYRPGMQDVYEHFKVALQSRAPRLGALLDALLGRPSGPDLATPFALHLWGNGAESCLPRDQQLQFLLTLLSSKEPNPYGMNFSSNIGQILRRMKFVEALPHLERAYLEGKHEPCFYAIGSFGGPDGVASVKRLLPMLPEERGNQLLRLLAQASGIEVDAFLWELTQVEKPGMRAQALNYLAQRPGNMDRILQRLRDASLPNAETQGLLSGLLHVTRGDKEARASLWKLYDSAPSLRDSLLREMLSHRDPGASERLSQRLGSGDFSPFLLQLLENADLQDILPHTEKLRYLAADTGSPLKSRGPAFYALYRVDRSAALQAFLTGFSRMDVKERIEAISFLDWSDAESRAALERIEREDPSEAVRKQAKDWMGIP